MQNDFVRVGAPLEVADARATISAHRALLDAFRRRGFPVAYTKFITRPGYTLLWECSPQCRTPTRCCCKGHPRSYPDVGHELNCTDINREVYPEPDGGVLEQVGYCAIERHTA